MSPRAWWQGLAYASVALVVSSPALLMLNACQR